MPFVARLLRLRFFHHYLPLRLGNAGLRLSDCVVVTARVYFNQYIPSIEKAARDEARVQLNDLARDFRHQVNFCSRRDHTVRANVQLDCLRLNLDHLRQRRFVIQ